MAEKDFVQKIYDSIADRIGERLLNKIKPKVRPDVDTLYNGDEFSSGTFVITIANEDITVHVENQDGDVVVWAENQSGNSQSREWRALDETVDDVSESAALSVIGVLNKPITATTK